MALVRWQPERDVLWNVQNEIGKLFDDLIERPLSGTRGGGRWYPEVDVEERADSYLVSMDAPGMQREDLKVSMEGNTLRIRGERKQLREEGDEDYRLNERRYGIFERSFTLPRSVDSGKIHARYRNGVLEITVPKAEEAKSREIEVDVK
ncbi:MAG: Hsp20/alpha crystallin family protein [bacterium]